MKLSAKRFGPLGAFLMWKKLLAVDTQRVLLFDFSVFGVGLQPLLLWCFVRFVYKGSLDCFPGFGFMMLQNSDGTCNR